MQVFRIIFLFACAVVLSACTSTRVDLDNSKFSTRIAQSGLKHFEVRLKNTEQSPQNVSTLENRQSRPREPRVNVDKLRRTLMAYADAYIEKNNYCRNSYWVMEVNAYGPIVSLRGECNEPATDADRQAFPDTISQW